MFKKIKSKILKARSLVSIKTYKRPMLFIIMLMIFINIVILLIAAAIALVIDDTFTSFIDAFANGSLKWLLTPNAILEIENPNTLFLAAIVLIIGMVLFTGTIIALTTNMIKEYFQKKKSGSGKIYLNDHIVILNWNNKVPELVADLLNVEDEDVTLVILAKIDKEYVENVNQSDAMDAAINGVLQSLDPYSAYMSPEVFKDMQTETSGKFGGLGIEVGMEHGVVKVISPIDNSPASRAGVKAGDYIVKINDIQVQGKSLTEAVEIMRGPVGSDIKITVRRRGVKKS